MEADATAGKSGGEADREAEAGGTRAKGKKMADPPSEEEKLLRRRQRDEDLQRMIEAEAGGTRAKGKKRADPPSEEEKLLRKRQSDEELQRMIEADEEDEDPFATSAALYREYWNWLWAPLGYFGSFEDTTQIGPMRYTDGPLPPMTPFSYYTDSIQVYSINVKELRLGLQWPLQVYGFVAARDSVDYNRNIVFNRTRDNCQTLTEKDSHLVLTGPTRAIRHVDTVVFEVVLKVKGTTESDDKDLSFLAVKCRSDYLPAPGYLWIQEYTSKLSTLELTLSGVYTSVEATISVRVTDGSWPGDFHGKFTARTACIDYRDVILLDSGDEEVSVAADGMIKLARRVVAAEAKGKLIVSVLAWQGDGKANVVSGHEEVFTPKDNGRSYGTFDIGFCKIEVTVAWSLISGPHSVCYSPPRKKVEDETEEIITSMVLL